jgi:thiamine biosynthesis protein ThiI
MEAYHRWHWPGSTHRDYEYLLADHLQLEPDRTYLLVCEFGLKSARIAELMQQAGYEAYSFLGGVKALRRVPPAESAAVATGKASPGAIDV